MSALERAEAELEQAAAEFDSARADDGLVSGRTLRALDRLKRAIDATALEEHYGIVAARLKVNKEG